MNTVGERALAACHSGSGVLSLYRSQWAGSERMVARVFDTASAAPLLDSRWEYAGTTGLPTLLETLDYLSLDIVFLVSGRGVDVLVPVWLGIPTRDGTTPPPSVGVLVRVRSIAALRGLRGRSRRLKTILGRAVESGLLTPAEARRWLWVLVGNHVPS